LGRNRYNHFSSEAGRNQDFAIVTHIMKIGSHELGKIQSTYGQPIRDRTILNSSVEFAVLILYLLSFTCVGSVEKSGHVTDVLK